MQLQSATYALTRILNVHPELSATLGIPTPAPGEFRTSTGVPKIIAKHSTIHLVGAVAPTPPDPRKGNTYLVHDGTIEQNADAIASLSAEPLSVIHRRPERLILQGPDGHNIDVVAIGHLVQSITNDDSVEAWTHTDRSRLDQIGRAIAERPATKPTPVLTARATVPGMLSIKRMRAEIDPDDEDMMPPFQLLGSWISKHCPRVRRELDYDIDVESHLVHSASGAPVGRYIRQKNRLHLARCTSLEFDIARSMRTDLEGRRLFEVPVGEPTDSLYSRPIAPRHVLPWTDDQYGHDRAPSMVAFRTWATEHHWHLAERWPVLPGMTNPVSGDAPPMACAATAVGEHGVIAIRHADDDEPRATQLASGALLRSRIEALLQHNADRTTPIPIRVITIAPGSAPLHEDIAIVPEIDDWTMRRLTRHWSNDAPTWVAQQERTWDGLLAPIARSVPPPQPERPRVRLESPEYEADYCSATRFGCEKVLAEALSPGRAYAPSYGTLVHASALRQVIKAAHDQRTSTSAPVLDEPLRRFNVDGYLPDERDHAVSLEATARLATELLGADAHVAPRQKLSRSR